MRVCRFAIAGGLMFALAGCDATTPPGQTEPGETVQNDSGSAVAAGSGATPEACLMSRHGAGGFTGTWTVDSGEAQFQGHSTRSGSNTLTLNSSNNDSLTLTIEGFPTVRLQRAAPGSPAWNWAAGPDVAISSEDLVMTYGCASQSEMARFSGQARIDADGFAGLATFRLILVGPNDGVLHWQMGPPLAGSGLFSISRVA
mgnify:CR=1 FL=1